MAYGEAFLAVQRLISLLETCALAGDLDDGERKQVENLISAARGFEDHLLKSQNASESNSKNINLELAAAAKKYVARMGSPVASTMFK